MAIKHGQKCVALDIQNAVLGAYPTFPYDGPFSGDQFFTGIDSVRIAFLTLGLPSPQNHITVNGDQYDIFTGGSPPIFFVNNAPASGDPVTAPTSWDNQSDSGADVDAAIANADAKLKSFVKILALGHTVYTLHSGSGDPFAAVAWAAGI